MSVGIYLHIPFCHHKCAYCDFLSTAIDGQVPDDYVHALASEIAMRGASNSESVHSVYFGGGTPSILTGQQMKIILQAIGKAFVLMDACEITVEMNPESYNRSHVEDYMLAGVNRFSVGLQSSHDRLLKTIGRLHDYASFEKTYYGLREQGAKNISVDLMFNLPTLTKDMLEETVSKIIALKPEHISTYSLKVEEGTPLFERVEVGAITIGDDDEDRLQHDLIRNCLLAEGFEHYEISNFAKVGYASRHNLTYWRNEDYIACGLGAHGKVKQRRYANMSSMDDYQKSIAKLQQPEESSEDLSQADIDFETVMLGIRISEGVVVEIYYNRYEKLQMTIEELVRDGLLEYVKGRLRLTERGRNLENQASYTIYEVMNDD